MTEQLVYLAMALVLGYFTAKIVGKVKLPAVTGYLIAGLILGLVKVIPMDTLHGFAILTDIALGFIAFSIGSEFKLSFLRQLGSAPIIIALFEAFGAVLVIFATLLIFGFSLPLALMLSAIGAATAPAATLMVVRQYKAKGPVTSMLLPVVAIDDAIALMIFSIAAAIAQVLVSGAKPSVSTMFLHPLYEIIGSLVVGAVLGLALALLLRFISKDTDRLVFACAAVLAGVGLAAMLSLSSLLTCMAMAAIYVNLSSHAVKTFKIADTVTPPLFMLFFVLSGAELDLTVLKAIGVMGAIYIVGRIVGKVGGCFLGAKIVSASDAVQKYLGLTLVPQAGVAIGLSAIALKISPLYGAKIRAVILCATLLYELGGPVLTKLALHLAGEIPGSSDKPAKRCRIPKIKANKS